VCGPAKAGREGGEPQPAVAKDVEVKTKFTEEVERQARRTTKTRRVHNAATRARQEKVEETPEAQTLLLLLL